MASSSKLSAVDDQAVQAFVESTPADLRQRLKHTLTYHGIDPEDYSAAFLSE